MEKDYLKECLALINKPDLEEAEKLLKEGVNNSPDNEKLLNLLGWVLYQREKYEEMIEIYKKLVKLNPMQSFSLFYNLGRAYFMTKEYRSAIDAFHKTLELAPTHKNALFYLSAAYEKLGDLKNSKKFLSKLVEQGKIDEDIKGISIQEGLQEFLLGEFVELQKAKIDTVGINYKRASFFGTWSINSDYLVLWSGSFETENFIEHVVFKGEGRIVFNGEPIVLVLSENDEIMITGSYLLGIDNLFECAFNKSNIIKIKGPRKVIIQRKPFFVEEVKEKDLFRKDKVFALIGNFKVKSVNENLLSVQKGKGKVLFI
ncbi:MAG: hypothetical protein OHK0040_08720 [bacterium]